MLRPLIPSFKIALAKNSVRSREDHVLQVGDKSLKILIESGSEMKDCDERPSTSTLPHLQKNKLDGEQSDRLSEHLTKKIFLHVSATLNTDLFTKDQREQVAHLFPNLNIEYSKLDGIEKVRGDFKDIENVYRYFDSLLKSEHYTEFSRSGRNNCLEEVSKNDQGKAYRSFEDRPIKSKLHDEFSHSGRNNSLEEVSKNDQGKAYRSFEDRPIKPKLHDECSHSGRKEDLKKMDINVQEKMTQNGLEEAYNIEIASAFYEYFNHVCEGQIKELELRFNVKIRSKENENGMTTICFEPTGSSRSVERAHQAFITAFKTETAELKQEKVHWVNSSQLNEVLQRLNTRFKGILAKIEGNELILRGSPNEISAAKMFLEMKEVNSPLTKAMKTTAEAYTHRNGVEVETFSYRCVETALAKEIEEIKRKYDVTMEYKKHLSPQKGHILFKPKSKNVDLSPHAYESFISAYQKALARITGMTLTVKLSENQKKKLNKFFEQFQKENPYVCLQRKEDHLILTGLPDRLSSAKENIKRFLDIEDSAQDHSWPALSSNSGFGAGAGASVEKNNDGSMNWLPSKEQPQPKAMGEGQEKDNCPICMDQIHQKEVLPKCKHEFCKACIQQAMKYKPACPVCNMSYGVIQGNQPDGTMNVSYAQFHIPGYGCGTIQIDYRMHGGIQTQNHPNPGRHYGGTYRTAYLPNNKEGKEILKLLRKAFDQKLIFTVGQSRTTGANDVITWNDIHHKTSTTGGPQCFGYPDPDYLKRVREELKAKGIE
uniref:E3 ubiquitin-protein ligase n=1 Tax=Sphenodon punctatus TaxID=8508 RepID=A0A8D0HHX9_SPHPU